MTDQLDQLTDAALSERVAVDVARWQNVRFPYATSAEAVTPLLEAWVVRDSAYRICDVSCSVTNGSVEWIVQLRGGGDGSCRGEAPTFARAACLALLRARGR